jgi:hypothetical protein
MSISKSHGEAISIAITSLVCSYIDQVNGEDIIKVLEDRDEATKRLIELGVPRNKGYSECSKRGKDLSFKVWKKVIKTNEE